MVGLGSPQVDNITELLQAWASGSDAALDSVMPLVYRDLHLMASRFWVTQRPGHMLQPTALIHEAYMKIECATTHFQNRHHFFALAATAMRQILVNRRRRASGRSEVVAG